MAQSYYQRKKAEQATAPAEMPTTNTESKPNYVALAIVPAGFQVFEVVELVIDGNTDQVISVKKELPVHFPLAVQYQKKRASFVWTGLEKV